MAESYPPKRDWTTAIAQWLTIATIVVGAIYWLAALEEAKNVSIDNDAEHDRRLNKQDDRVRDIENSRRLEDKIASLTAQVAALSAKVDTLIASDKRRRR